jgi:hypothetical protein
VAILTVLLSVVSQSSRKIVTCIYRQPYEGRGAVHTRFWWGNRREREHLENRGLDGRITLMWIFTKWDGVGGKDWIGLAQDRDRWRVL